jgi:hypothetical protein
MIIPQKVLDKKYSKQVRVQGWPARQVFDYLYTTKGVHVLRNPKTKKTFKTGRDLEYTRRNLPVSVDKEYVSLDNTL